ncbi:MAG: hypothetical protein LCH99_15445 [Proteobacteria bacterium]|nr:hypothetical protein [Pseudomonadota bacterium]
MDYATLVAGPDVKGSIQYAINYARIDSEGILEEAQAWIYSKIRTRDMIATADVPIAEGLATAEFPPGYLDAIHFGVPGYINRLRLKDVEWFRTHLGWDENAALPDGLPTYWCDTGSAINLNTKADQDYTAKMVFYRRPTALSSSNTTNFLTTRYPTLLRRACLMFAAEARKEYDTLDREEVRALQAVKDIMVEDDVAKRGMELDFNWDAN